GAAALGLDPNTTKFTRDVQIRMGSWIHGQQGLGAWRGFEAHPEELYRAQQAIANAPRSTPIPGGAEAPIPSGGGKVLPSPAAAGVNAQLNRTMEAAFAAVLPKGYTARVTSGVRGGNPSSQHFTGSAEDWQIFDPQGRPISNRGEDTTGLYRKAAVEGL